MITLDIRKEVNTIFGMGYQFYTFGNYTHTAGCCLEDFPDVITIDCAESKARHLIRALHDRWMEDGFFTGEAVLGQALNGTPMRVNVVILDEEEASNICFQAERLYEYSDDLYRGNQPCAYVQLIWSDAYGRLPHEEGYNQDNYPQRLMCPARNSNDEIA